MSEPVTPIEARGEISWVRMLALMLVFVSLLSIIFILDFTSYPTPLRRMWIFQHLLLSQDILGAALIIGIALAAYIPWTRRPALALIDAIGRKPWLVAGVTFVVLSLAMKYVALDHALAGDEYLAIFQSKIFAAGHLTGKFPPDLVNWLTPIDYQDRWIIVSHSTGAVAAAYWPGFALLLVPFVLAGIPWACNPMLASLSLVLIGRLAGRLTGSPQATGWAMLLAIGSPEFTGMALSYFSMTAHLFLNLAFACLILERTPRRLILAGVVGSLALIQHNPVPHALFALPWIIWLVRGENRRRNFYMLAAGYAPVALIVGIGGMIFLRDVQGRIWMAPFALDEDLSTRTGYFLWYWKSQLEQIFVGPSSEVLSKRIGELVRLWTWTVPGLPILAIAGWWLGRHVTGVRLLALSFASTMVGYSFVWFDQGFGWGARYLHPAFAALPILGAAAMVLIPNPANGERLRAYVGSAALLSLIFSTALRFWQINVVTQEHVSKLPPIVAGVRQVVVIKRDNDYFTQDLARNDPFLRDPVIFVISHGFEIDSEVIPRRFPGARLVFQGEVGEVWRLE